MYEWINIKKKIFPWDSHITSKRPNPAWKTQEGLVGKGENAYLLISLLYNSTVLKALLRVYLL